jgi:extracellular elastinolytic metalloproteinase
MRLYLWTTASPYRDSALDTSVVVHELTRGLSIRLTGGPAKVDCLARGESAGLGVGWADFIAGVVGTRGQGDFAMGSWTAANQSTGIRKYAYSQVCLTRSRARILG